jgi:hypothetical protein
MSTVKLITPSSGSISLTPTDTASNLTLTVPAQAGSIVTADSSGNVGIGTSSPAANRKLIIGNTGAASTMRINAPTGYDAFIEFTENNSVSANTYWQIDKTPSTHALQFWNGSERMRIDSSGRVTMPYQPAFAAWNSSGVSATAVIVFTTTRVNVGSVYNTANGRFTAPISGNYWISYYGLANSGNCNIGMNVNGSRIYYSESDESNYHQIGVSGMLALSAGDYVEIQCYTGSLYQNYNNFSGWLVS